MTVNPYWKILQLSVGDFLAKTLSFIAFVYVARVLGVETYGVLEFSLAVTTYFLWLADSGLELWATRAVAQGEPVTQLAGLIVPLRIALALLAYGLLLLLLPLLPAYPLLRSALLLFGLTLFIQGVSLKWVFMGREQMSMVAIGLIAAQILFACAMLILVRDATDILWVPVLRLTSDTTMAGYFGYLYVKHYGWLQIRVTMGGARHTLRNALVLGGAHGLAQISYNFDSILLGLWAGSTAVGWYNAAYRPITALLALPVSYFLGLFPVLSRTFRDNPIEFQAMMAHSVRMLAMLAIPIGIGGTVWAQPAITLLFGPAYANAILPLQVLSWSAALVIIRGTYRQALNAAGRQDLDLRCAFVATAVNVTLNLVLIPYFSIVGAALATLSSEIVWLALIVYLARRHITQVRLIRLMVVPAKAAAVACVGLWFIQPLWWLYQVPLTALLYLCLLIWWGEGEIGSWPLFRRLQPS